MAHPEGSGRVTYDTVAIGLSNAVRPGVTGLPGVSGFHRPPAR